MFRALCLSIAVMTSFATGRVAADARCRVSADEPYLRETAPGQANGVVFFVLHNGDAVPHTLVRVESAAAERVQLHTHVQSGGRLTMKQVAEVEVPVGGEVVFAPGGLHVMLLGLRAPLRAGETVAFDLVFEGGCKVSVRAPVRALRPAS
jgi:periplasmic copper chaperone A